MRFRLLVPPATEPVSTSDFMAFARIDTDPADGVMQRLLLAARERVERDSGLALITQTWVAMLDGWHRMGRAPEPHAVAPGWRGDGRIEIARRPLQSLVSIQVRDVTGALQSVDPATYRVETTDDVAGIIRQPGAVWPLVEAGLADAIEITVTLGFGDDAASVPAELQTAVLMLAAHWHETREPVIDGRFGPAPEHLRSILRSWQAPRLR